MTEPYYTKKRYFDFTVNVPLVFTLILNLIYVAYRAGVFEEQLAGIKENYSTKIYVEQINTTTTRDIAEIRVEQKNLKNEMKEVKDRVTHLEKHPGA